MLHEILTAAGVAAVLAAALALVNGRARWRAADFGEHLAVLFPATWAGGIWLQPFGPALGAIHPLPFVATGVVLALVLLVAGRPRPPRSRHETLDMLDRINLEKKAEMATGSVLRILFWTLLVLLAAAIVLRHLA